jgi:RNA polymerase sigma-70 factor (ECF subfamily)
MRVDAENFNRDTLHRELLVELAKVRTYVQRKIPVRLRAQISPDDILQEVWVAAYRGFSTFVPKGPRAMERWLTVIAKRTIANATKGARRLKRGGHLRQVDNVDRRCTSFADLFAHVTGPTRTPSSEFNVIERGHAVGMALNRLSNDQRQAVYMRYIEGKSRQEIADALGKTVRAVHGLVQRGLRQLRSHLGDAEKYFSDARSSDAAASR